ncbi:MAG: peptidase MA family metallohydrolase [Deltaproteobacteria bacterium]
MIRSFLSIATVTLCCGTTARAAEKPAAASRPVAGEISRTYTTQGWLVQESASFRVFCRTDCTDAKRLPAACEALRRQLQETWFGEATDAWSLRCDIVLHPSVAGYVRELGPGSQQSSGCATIEIEKGRVVKRRVDLRADAADWMSSSLPHELTHVVLADKFATKQVPRWADEGMAILSEPADRQSIRRSAMQRAFGRAPRYAAGDLLALREYPSGDHRDAFYGQSASLVAYLIERDSPEKFIEFLELGQRKGFEPALAEIYGLRSLAALDARWHPQLLDRGPSAGLFAARIARITSGRQID